MSASIVVADDDSDILELVLLRLQMAGYDAVGATNGAEALELTRSRMPDLCILDVRMPYMDGFEVLRQLRRDESTAAIRVILLTASVEDADVIRGLEYGADDFLRKPFKPADLQKRVEGLLARA